MKKALVVYSGGADSLTALHWARVHFPQVEAVTVDYGQRHRIEIHYAKNVTSELGIEHHIIDLSSLRGPLSGSALTSNSPMPTGHYQAENMRQTVVPNRNAILINVAAGLAITRGCSDLVVGVHAGDHYIYPDCRPEFIKAQADILQIAGETPIGLHAPFLMDSKAKLMAFGTQLNIDYTDAWTCYDPQADPAVAGNWIACGVCGACVERKESVAESGAFDNTEYMV